MGNKTTKKVLPVPEYLKIRRYAMNRLYHLKKEDDLKLPSLQEMMAMFEVSRPTVRKALKDLVKDGYLIPRPGIGMFVNPKYLDENKSLRSSRLVIGILMSDGMLVHLDTYFAEILAEILHAVGKIPAFTHELQLPGIPERRLFDYLKSEQLDALLWVHPGEKHMSVIRRLRESGLPVATLCAERKPGIDADVYFDMQGLGKTIGKILAEENRTKILYLGRKLVESEPYEEIFRVFEEKALPCGELHFIEINDRAEEKIRRFLEKGKIQAVVNLFMPYERLNALLHSAGKGPEKECLLIQNGVEISGEDFSCGIRFDFPFREAAQELVSRITEKQERPVSRLPFRMTMMRDER